MPEWNEVVLFLLGCAASFLLGALAAARRAYMHARRHVDEYWDWREERFIADFGEEVNGGPLPDMPGQVE